MKFKHEPIPKPWDYRTVTRFLLWPKRIHDETRWLETATWTEQYETGLIGGDRWIEHCWDSPAVTKPEPEQRELVSAKPKASVADILAAARKSAGKKA